MNRPTGVTVLAILMFIGTAVCVLIGIGCFLGGAFLGSMIASAAKQSGGAGLGAGAGAVIGGIAGVLFFFIAALNGLCGFGLWNLKEWARMLTIVLTAVGLVFAVMGLLFSVVHFHIFSVFIVLVRIAIAAVVIWYLSQPEVKAAFASPQPYIAR